MIRRSTWWAGFLFGSMTMLALQSTILQPPYPTTLSFAEYDSCLGLRGMNVLLLEIHLEGNLGDEMETTPLLQEFQRCGIHVTAALSHWLERPELRIGGGSAREHALIDTIYPHSTPIELSLQEYSAIILAPGPWRLCSLHKVWTQRIDIFMGGSIIPEPPNYNLSECLGDWKPSLFVVREPYSMGLVQDLNFPAYMSGDFSHGFQPVNSTWHYWKSVYSKFDERILIFTRASNAANVISIHGWNVELTTLMDGIVSVPLSHVIIATSSPLEDSAWIQEFQQQNPRFPEHQFVQCQSVEQLWALVAHSTHIYTDRYHPGIVGYHFGKKVTVLRYKDEETKLVGLVQVMATEPSGIIQKENNAKAFELMRDTLRQLRDRAPERVQPASTSEKKKPTTSPGEQPYAIVVGLPKSGTTSIYHYFSCSGFRTTHYCCCGTHATEYPCSGGKLLSQQLRENLDAGRPLWYGTGDKVVHAQLDGESATESYFLPQHYHLNEIHQSAPNAFWILPLRSAKTWKMSVQKWLDMADRLRAVHERHHPNEDFDLESFYDQHTALVRDFCQQNRPKLCVEVTIDDPDAGKVLSQSFRNGVSRCWGQHNAGPFFQTLLSNPSVQGGQI